MSTKQRILVWFSCGGPSAVAAKMAIDKLSATHEVLVVNCDTRPSEHPDNYRFSQQVALWIKRPIIYIRSEKYKDVDDVFDNSGYTECGSPGLKF